MGITVLSSRAEDWIPSVELRCRDAIVTGELAAVITRYRFGIFIAVSHDARLCGDAGRGRGDDRCCRGGGGNVDLAAYQS